MDETVTPEQIAAGLIDDEVLEAGLGVWDGEDASHVITTIFVAMMAVLIRREQSA